VWSDLEGGPKTSWRTLQRELHSGHSVAEAMMSAFRRFKWRAAAILCVLSLSGCADSLSPTGGSGDGRASYPLTVGNRWVYAGRASVTVDSLGSQSSRVDAPLLEVQILSDSAYSLGQYYAREGSRSGSAEYMPRTWYVNLVRQDSEGLYQMIPAGYLRSTDRQAASAAGGAGLDATRLVFPLHLGSSWVNQNGLDARVEGMDYVSVPAGRFVARRIGLRHSSSDPTVGTVVEHDWYGDVGLVKYTFHWEHQAELRDSTGAQVGVKTITYDAVHALQSFVLVGSPGNLVPLAPALSRAP